MKKLFVVLALGVFAIGLAGCSEFESNPQATPNGLGDNVIDSRSGRDIYKMASFEEAQAHPEKYMSSYGEKSKAQAFKLLYNEPAANIGADSNSTSNYIGFLDKDGKEQRVIADSDDVIEVVDTKADTPYFISDGSYLIVHRLPYQTYEQEDIEGTVLEKVELGK